MYVPRGMYIFTRKMKKIVALGLTLVLSLGLVACGNDQARDSSNGSKEDTAGVVEDISSSNEYSEELSAFKDFYNEYCEEHYCEFEHMYEENIDGKTVSMDFVPYFDCGAKIDLYEGELVLIIADLVSYKEVSWDDDDGVGSEICPVFDVAIYTYDSEVVELSKIDGIVATYGGIYVRNIGNECFIGGGSDSYLVQLDSGTYENANDKEQELDEKYGRCFIEYVVAYDDGYTDVMNSVNNDYFTSWLDYLRTQTFANSFDLNLLYVKYLIDNNVCCRIYEDWNKTCLNTIGYEYGELNYYVRGFINYYENGAVYRYIDNDLIIGNEEYLNSEEFALEFNEDNQRLGYTEDINKSFFLDYVETEGSIASNINGIKVYQRITYEMDSTIDIISASLSESLNDENVYNSMVSYQNKVISFEDGYEELPEEFKTEFENSYSFNAWNYGYDSSLPERKINENLVYAFKIDDGSVYVYVATRDLNSLYQVYPEQERSFIPYE